MFTMAATEPALDLHISITGAEPAIWRALRVPSTMSLPTLHLVIQRSFGWENRHLYMFTSVDSSGTERRFAGSEETALELDMDSAEGVRLGDVTAEGTRLSYEYDFGDSWDHTIAVVEHSTIPIGEIHCLDGRNRGPIEDAGGIGGYAGKIDILTDRDHPEYLEIAQWYYFVTGEIASSFDPAAFDRNAVNRGLERLSAGLRREAPTPEEVADVVRPVRWLLERVGEDGLELTKDGFLKPAVVTAAMAEIGWQDRWIGKFNRENQTQPVWDLRVLMQQWKLLRKYQGKLVRTPTGRKLHNDDAGLWKYLAARLAIAESKAQELTDTMVVDWLLADQLPPREARSRIIADSLTVAGFRMPGGAQVPPEVGADLFGDMRRSLETLNVFERERKYSAQQVATLAGLQFLAEVQRQQNA